jgi:hypothetical protein
VSDRAAEVGGDQWLRQVFDIAAREAIFRCPPPDPSSAVAVAPMLVLLGGPPASGKTRTHGAIVAQHSELVPITGDELRRYHPAYDRLVTTDPLRMPAATTPVSGGLVRLALDHALQHRYSVLLEGVFRDPAVVTGTAERFAAAGYSVGVVATALPAPVSRLAAEQRFLGAPSPRAARWTPPTAHESSLRGSPAVLAELEACRAVTWVQLSARTQPIYDNTRTSDGHWQGPPAADEHLRHEQTRDLTPHEALGWLADYEALFALARERTGYLNPATLPAYRLLQADAARLMRSVRPLADITQLRYRQRERDAALNQRDATLTRRLEFPEQDPLRGRIQTDADPGQVRRVLSHRTRAVPQAERNDSPRMSP